jgi:uncharacterized protein (DUF2235 family)
MCRGSAFCQWRAVVVVISSPVEYGLASAQRRCHVSSSATQATAGDTMALYAFDGTGNEDQEDPTRDSNVVDFFTAYIDPKKNDDPDETLGSLYLKGIGRRARLLVGRTLAEAFGIGGHKRVRQAMERLENNIDAGDSVVDIVGFSRGGAIAVSFANEIAAKVPDVRVRFLGLFDVVGQFGLPGERVNAGHILRLPKNVDHCFHAMAMDESRALFPLTRLCDDNGQHGDELVEVWFRGVHSDIGGGNGNRGLNWIALHWMFMAAKRVGLPIAQEAIDQNLADRDLPQQIGDHKFDFQRRRKFFQSDCLHSSVVLSEGIAGRPHNNPTFPLRRVNDDGEFVTG